MEWHISWYNIALGLNGMWHPKLQFYGKDIKQKKHQYQTGLYCFGADSRKKAVTAYFSSKQLMLFPFAGQTCVHVGVLSSYLSYFVKQTICPESDVSSVRSNEANSCQARPRRLRAHTHVFSLTLTTLKYFSINYGYYFFPFEIIKNVLLSSSWFIWIPLI